jgi:hypothetical protein
MLEVCHACVAAQKVLGWPRAGVTAAAPAGCCYLRRGQLRRSVQRPASVAGIGAPCGAGPATVASVRPLCLPLAITVSGSDNPGRTNQWPATRSSTN